MGTLVVLLILVLAVALIFRSMARDRKRGVSPLCGGNCSACGGHCHQNVQDEEKK